MSGLFGLFGKKKSGSSIEENQNDKTNAIQQTEKQFTYRTAEMPIEALNRQKLNKEINNVIEENRSEITKQLSSEGYSIINDKYQLVRVNLNNNIREDLQNPDFIYGLKKNNKSQKGGTRNRKSKHTRHGTKRYSTKKNGSKNRPK